MHRLARCALCVSVQGAYYSDGIPSDRIPKCLECSGSMQHVGDLSCGAVSEDLVDVSISLFYCSGCEIQCCVDDIDDAQFSD